MTTSSVPAAAAGRRAVRVALRLGVVMLASGGQAQEVEGRLRVALRALGLPEADAVISYSTVMVSYVSPGDAEATTAIRAVRRWSSDFNRLAAAAILVRDIGDGRADLDSAEAELDRIAASGHSYPEWLRFGAPAAMTFAVTIMFGGSVLDAMVALAIGLAIQPALDRLGRSGLSSFFQVVVGVGATTLVVVLLAMVVLPIHGSLVLTGSLLRFLPGYALVVGMHDLIDGSVTSGVARLAEVALVGTAIAGAASLILSLGDALDVHLRIRASGPLEWPSFVIVAAAVVAVGFNACSFGVPRRSLLAVGGLGAIAAIFGRGLTPLTAEMGLGSRTFLAALAIGVIAGLLSNRSWVPSALWAVPAILPLLPSPATLLPLLAESEGVRESLQARAVETAFAIGVGVAAGAIVVETYQRTRERVLNPVVEAASTEISERVLGPIQRLMSRTFVRFRPPRQGGRSHLDE